MARIVERVRQDGDRALLAYAKRFDGLDGPIEVPRAEMVRAAASLEPRVWSAIRLASRHIARVAAKQVPKGWTVAPVPGIQVAQRVVPLDRVGCYVPGGRYPLPSSLLMTAIPASIAGVREIVAVCPRVDRTVMAAALAAGVTRLLRVGGAHAIAALAYGTKTIARVDKIVGPGNAYVAAAKAIVAADCAIDFFAGPSEIAIVSSAGNASWIAADLIAQAEHDPDARGDPLHAFPPPCRGGERGCAPADARLGAGRQGPPLERRRRPDPLAGRGNRTLPADGAGTRGVRFGERGAAADARRNRVRGQPQCAGGW